MRYFIYKDSQIVGPFEREELDQAGGLRPETLLCPEGVSGRRDADWQCLEEIAELSGVATLPPTALGVVDSPIDAGSTVLERLELETLGVAGGDDPDWLRGLFDDSEFQQRWGLSLKRDDDPARLSDAEGKVKDLTGQLAALRSRIGELEGQQAALLERLSRSQPLVQSPPAVAEPTPSPAPFSSPESAAPQPPPLPQSLPAPLAFSWGPPQQQAPLPEAPAVFQPKLPVPIAGVPAPRFELLPPEPAVEELPIKFGETRTLPKAEIPPGHPFEWNEPPAPAGGLPAAGVVPDVEGIERFPMPEAAPAASASPAAEAMETAPALAPAPAPVPEPLAVSEPFFAAAPAPELSLQPPATMRFSAIEPAGAPAAVPALEPPPIPADMNNPFGAPSQMLPPAGAETGEIPRTQEVLARLARPAPAPETAARPKTGGSRKYLVISGVLLVLLIGLGLVFLRNSRDLKSMLSMGTDQKPIGVEGEAPGAAPKPDEGASAAAPQPPAPQPVAPEPEPVPVVDIGEQAISLVKEYPLDGERGTVAQWLQYSFTANPGDGNKEEWTAGAVDASTYLVQYRMLPGAGSSVKEPITYLFEADVERKTVKGSNPASRQLMGGAPPAKPKPKAKSRPATAVRRRPKPVRSQPKELPLMPLPSDSDLLPPAEDDSGFKNDTVNPPL